MTAGLEGESRREANRTTKVSRGETRRRPEKRGTTGNRRESNRRSVGEWHSEHRCRKFFGKPTAGRGARTGRSESRATDGPKTGKGARRSGRRIRGSHLGEADQGRRANTRDQKQASGFGGSSEAESRGCNNPRKETWERSEEGSGKGRPEPLRTDGHRRNRLNMVSKPERGGLSEDVEASLWRYASEWRV